MEEINNFHVILNGCNTKEKTRQYDVRKKYGIVDKFIFVFVGNVSKNKNQKQVVDAFLLLPDEYKDKFAVLFVGGGDYIELKNYIARLGLNGSLFVCGLVPKNEVHNYYIAGNATILTSYSEGFGLSLVEGMCYGLPCVTFADLAVVNDIYNEGVMVKVKERSTAALSKGMVNLYEKKWNHDNIKEYADRFSYDNMANNYLNFYCSILK